MKFTSIVLLLIATPFTYAHTKTIRRSSAPALGAYRDASGLLWGNMVQVGQEPKPMTLAEADRYCKSRRLRLPTVTEFERLSNSLGGPNRYSPYTRDRRLIVSGIRNWYWTQPEYSSTPPTMFYLGEDYVEESTYDDGLDHTAAVRCVTGLAPFRTPVPPDIDPVDDDIFCPDIGLGKVVSRTAGSPILSIVFNLFETDSSQGTGDDIYSEYVAPKKRRNPVDFDASNCIERTSSVAASQKPLFCGWRDDRYTYKPKPFDKSAGQNEEIVDRVIPFDVNLTGVQLSVFGGKTLSHVTSIQIHDTDLGDRDYSVDFYKFDCSEIEWYSSHNR